MPVANMSVERLEQQITMDVRYGDENQTARRANSPGFFSLQKSIVLLLWFVCIGGYLFYLWQQEMTVTAALAQIDGLLHSPYGPLLYLFLFVLRSLFFFSAGILSIAGGVIFGSGAEGNLWLALIYVLLGTLASALVSFALARFFGGNLVERFAGGKAGSERWAPYVSGLRNNGFMAVLLMRLLLLPFDPINYLAGFAKVNWRAFAMATAIGIIPTVFAFVSFGAAIDMQALIAGQMPQVDLQLLATALIILLISLLASRYYQRRSSGSVR